MRIGILTGGADCQGMNAAIRAVVRAAGFRYHWEVTGFTRGWSGLIEDQPVELDQAKVSGILHRGGTILGTSRPNPNRIEGKLRNIFGKLKTSLIDALVVIGDRDTLRIALMLKDAGIPVIGIPATVDNDLGCTDYSIGFFTAVNVVSDAVDKLHTTASSHHRVMIVEVMGRDSGWVALFGGLAGGADWIMIPEVQPHFEDVIGHLKARTKLGKEFSIIVLAEGASLPEVPVASVACVDDSGKVRLDSRSLGVAIAEKIEESTGFEARVTVLGHLQRGGSPVVSDRIIATGMGVEAVELIRKKKFGRMVTFINNGYGSVDLSQVVKESPRMVPIELYNLAGIFY